MQSTVNQRFKSLRIKLGLSQVEFANAMNLSQTFVSRIEKEETDIPTNTLITICEKYGISSDWLLFGKGEMQQDQVQTQSQGQSAYAPPPGYILIAMEDFINYVKPRSE